MTPRHRLVLALAAGLMPALGHAAPIDLTGASIFDRDTLVLTHDAGGEPVRFGPTRPDTIPALRGFVRARQAAIHRCLGWHRDHADRRHPAIPLWMHIGPSGRVTAEAFTGQGHPSSASPRPS